MEFSDFELADVFEVARRTVLSMERDADLADDLASMTVERILSRNPDIRPGRLNAYAAQVARNLMRDELRSRTQHRVKPIGEDWQLEEARAIFGIALHTKSPSFLVIKSERIQRRYSLAQKILASLPERHRELLELSAFQRGRSLNGWDTPARTR